MHDLEMTYKRRFEEDSHYDSDINSHAVEAEVVSRPSGQWTLQTGADWLHEYAAHTGTEEDYTLTSLAARNMLHGSGRRARACLARWPITASSVAAPAISPRWRQARGRPVHLEPQLSYSLNPYTQLTGEYTGESYPQRRRRTRCRWK
jgi:hypothetical protein